MPDQLFEAARDAFDQDALKRVCEMHETEFAAAYDMEVTFTPKSLWGDSDGYPPFYAFLDRGADILAVAHLDTVMPHSGRTARFVDTEDGPVVFSGALDDRLGAYTILELLPRLGVDVDVLLTTGEESGCSTAEHFEPGEHHDREYRWMIEFDRGGTDVVMYQYEDRETEELVEASGARVGSGSFSDIAFLEHLEIKGFNWGVGYEDYHGPRSHAFLEDYWEMVGYFLRFHSDNADTYLPHDYRPAWGSGRGGGWGKFDDEWCDECCEYIDMFEWAEHEEAHRELDRRFEEEEASEDFATVNRMLTAGDGERKW